MKKIAIHSVPRSGSSWLGEIVNSSGFVDYSFQPLFSYAFKAALSGNSSRDEINKFYQNLLLSKDDFIMETKGRIAGHKPNFHKENITHVVYKEVRYHYVLENLLEKDPQQKIIGLVRNPLSVLNSWLNAPREFRVDLGWDFNKEWKHAASKNKGKDEEYFGYFKWKEFALLCKDLAQKYPDNFLLVNYSDLLSNTTAAVETIFRFLELPINKQTKDFIQSSGSTQVDDTYSIYREKTANDDAWRENIPCDIVNEIVDDCNASGLSEFVC